jgi:hypothetical protein
VKWAPLSWLFGILVVGCGRESGTEGSATAGTGQLSGWSVSPAPVVTLGGTGATGEDQFTTVDWVTRLSSGEIVVLEQADSELRFFDETGVHIRTVGRRGDGPGEFSNRPLKLSRTYGDTLLVVDWPRTGVMVFGSDGRYVRSERLEYMRVSAELGAGLCPNDVPILADGSVLGCSRVSAPTLTEAPAIAAQTRRTRELVRVRRGGTVADTLGQFINPEFYDIQLGDMIAILRHPFGSLSFVAAGVDPLRVYIANNPAYAVEVWSADGQLERVVSREDARFVADDQLKERAWAEALTDIAPENQEAVRSTLPAPDSIPAIYGLAAGPDGELWVQREPFLKGQARAVLDIFDSEGIYLGSLTLPSALMVKEVGEDYILGVRRDEFDVPIVELYALTRG